MEFRAKFARGDETLLVSGELLSTERGPRGTFTFSIADAPTIAPGPALLITETGETWKVMVLNTTTPSGEDHGECEFRFRSGDSSAQIVM